MAVDEKLGRLINKVRSKVRSFKWTDDDGEEFEIKFARLTLNDCIELDQETGRNIFAELAEGTGGESRTSLFRTFSWELQRKIAFKSLRKVYPQITETEVGEIISAMPQDVFWAALAFALWGAGPEVPTAPSPAAATTRSSGGTSGSQSSSRRTRATS